MNNKLGNAFDIDTGSEKWKAQEISTQSVPLVDPGTGKPYIIRSFTFRFSPMVMQQIKQRKIPVPSDQDLFNSVWPQIRVMLWGDGLIAVQEKELPPKLKIKSKTFTVIIVCEPRLGHTIIAKHKSLNDYLKPTR